MCRAGALLGWSLRLGHHGIDPFNVHKILNLNYSCCSHSADEETEAIKVDQLAQGPSQEMQRNCKGHRLHSHCS